MNELIDKRDERTKKRKAVKRKMDSVIGLSASEDKAKHHIISLATETMTLSGKSIRLLDEGYIDNGFVIKKGTLEKYLKGQNQYVRGWEFDGEDWIQTEVLNLTDDFVGTVNLGHMEFATFPFIVGEWRKEDLHLVDIGSGRTALDVNLRLDPKSFIVKELHRQPYDVGESADAYTLNLHFIALILSESIHIEEGEVVGYDVSIHLLSMLLLCPSKHTISGILSSIKPEDVIPHHHIE